MKHPITTFPHLDLKTSYQLIVHKCSSKHLIWKGYYYIDMELHWILELIYGINNFFLSILYSFMHQINIHLDFNYFIRKNRLKKLTTVFYIFLFLNVIHSWIFSIIILVFSVMYSLRNHSKKSWSLRDNSSAYIYVIPPPPVFCFSFFMNRKLKRTSHIWDQCILTN